MLIRDCYLSPGDPLLVELAGKAGKRIFNAITASPTHVLSKYLPNLNSTGHNLTSSGLFNLLTLSSHCSLLCKF